MTRDQPDSLSQLARAGAERAAAAFEQLADRPVAVRDVVTLEPGERGRAFSGEWSSGVFFELEGCFDALVGVLFRSSARDAIVESMLGEEAKTLAGWCIESAITEVSNILVSHVASGIADALGERLLPSVPALALDRAERALAEHAGARIGRPRVECELAAPDGELGGLLVLVPGRGTS